MSLARKLRREQKRKEEGAAKKRRRKVLLEPLEQRLLLSSDLAYTAAIDEAADLTLRLQNVDSVDTLQLVSNVDQSIVQSQALSDTRAVVIVGSDQDDSLTVDFSTPFSIPIFYDGGSQATPTGDSLQVIGDGQTTGSYTPDPTQPGSGRLSVGGSSITFSGLEPITVSGQAEYTFATLGSEDLLTIDSPMSGRNRISGTSGGTAFESVTFFDVSHFIIDTGANDAASPNDSITLGSTLVASGLQNITIRTGAGDDSLIIHTYNFSLPVSGGAFIFDGGAGSDTVDFDASSGGYSGALTMGQSGSDATVTGTYGALTLKGGTVEKIDDATINIQKDSLATLLNDLEVLSDWVRKVAEYGELGSRLPFLFAGDQSVVNLGNAVEFADAVDHVRSKLHEYYKTLGSTFTINALETTLKNIAGSVEHYAGSIVGDFLPSFGGGETANITISLDGGTGQAISFKGGSNLEEILGHINEAITNNAALTGKIMAYDAGGRVAFKAVDINVVDFAVGCVAGDPAFTKLGLRLNQTMKAAGLDLGALSSVGNLIQNANTWITIDPATLTPRLSIKLPFDFTRTSTFGADFGREIRELKGLAFDASAQLAVTTRLTADIDIGLELDASPDFWVTVNDLSARAQVTPPPGSSNLTADLTVGFLGAHVDGTVNLDAGVSIDVPGRLSLSDLQGPLSGISVSLTQHSFSFCSSS